MTRLYDKARSRGLTSAHGTKDAAFVTRALRDAVVVNADEVCGYFFAHADKGPGDWQLARDVPNVAPPFGSFFIEMRKPPALSEPWRRFLADGPPVDSWGVLFRATDLVAFYADHGHADPEAAAHERATEVFADHHAAHQRPMESSTALKEPERRGEAARWLLGMDLFLEVRGSRRVLTGAFGLHGVVSADGRFCRTADGTADGREHGAVRYWVAQELFDEAPGIGPEEVVRQSKSYCGTLLLPALLAVAFTHCKNVTLTDESPPAKLSKKHHKKHGRPLTTHKTLYIDPMKEVLRKEGAAARTGIRRALHLCRGHFKHYTPERGGPFGRSIERPETVWIPQHARGSVRRGEVRKDYGVGPADERTSA